VHTSIFAEPVSWWIVARIFLRVFTSLMSSVHSLTSRMSQSEHCVPWNLTVLVRWG
jgi:hypothetical protein